MRKLLILFFILSITFIKAQSPFDLKVKSSELSNKAVAKVTTFGFDNQYYYCFVEKAGFNYDVNYFLAKYSIDLKLISENEIKVPEHLKDGKFEFTTILDRKLLIGYSGKNSKTKEIQLCVQEVDKESLQFIQNEKVLAKIDLNAYDNYESYSIYSKVDLENDVVLIVPIIAYTIEKKVMNDMSIYIFSDKLTPMFQFKGESLKNQMFVDEIDCKYSTDGLLTMSFKSRYSSKAAFPLLLVDNKDGSIKRDLQKLNYKYHLIKVDKEKVFTKYEFSDENIFIRNLSAFPIGNDSILIVGFYSDKNKYSVKGNFCTFISTATDNTIVIENLNPFSKEFEKIGKTEYEIARTKKSLEEFGESDPYDYNTLSIYPRNEGGFITISEQSLIYYSLENTREGSSIQKYNLNDDIILTYINSKGEIEDLIKIPKRQRCYAINTAYEFKPYMYSNFTTLYNNENFYFVFNDLRFEQMKLLVKVPGIVIIKLDKDLTQQTISYPSFSMLESNLFIKNSIKISNNELIIPQVGIMRKYGIVHLKIMDE